jgi:hypothetical protein
MPCLHQTNPEAKSAAILFGGMNYHFCKSEVWALDLRWRKTGVEQFDGTQSQAIDNEMNGLPTRGARSMSLPSDMPSDGQRLPSADSRRVQNGKFPNSFREFVQQHSQLSVLGDAHTATGASQDFTMQV